MPKHFIHTFTLAIAILSAAVVLKYSPPVDAGGTTRVTKDIQFRRVILRGDGTPHVLGVVPAGTRLYLKDFYVNGFESAAGAEELHILIGGVDTYTIQVGSTGDFNRPFSLSTGFPVDAGNEIAVKRMNRYDPGADIDLIVGATSVVL